MRTARSGFDHYLLPRWLRMLAMSGFFADGSSRILDFGCGTGRDVYAWRDAGYSAHGFDITDSVQLRRPEDRRWFKSLAFSANNPANYSLDWKSFQLPYDEASFDFVFSLTVLEHVQNLEVVLRELSRVMKKQSIAFHIFPPRYVTIEPHISVPLGGVIQNYPWFWFWARCGVRNEFQRAMNARETAQQNLAYSASGLNYRPPREILTVAARYYHYAHFTPDLWEFDNARLRRRMNSKLYRMYYSYRRTAVLRLIKDGDKGEAF